jgi:uncharacterized protein YfaS (alpha-2-macroglobulin family)
MITTVTPTGKWYLNQTVQFLIRGSNFEPGFTDVTFTNAKDGSILNATGFVIDTITDKTINGTIVVPYNAPLGTWNVSVTTLNGGRAWKSSAFTVATPSKTMITTVTPTGKWYLNQTVQFLIRGSNFEPGFTDVTFTNAKDGSILNATGFVIDTITDKTINGTIVVPYNAPLGTWNVSVTTLNGGRAWKSSAFTVATPSKTMITTVTPTGKWYLNQTVQFLIKGSNFEPGFTDVTFTNAKDGSILNATGFVIDTITDKTINGTIVVPYNAPLGTWNVSVTTLNGGRAWKSSALTVARLPAPTIGAIAPNSGSRNSTVAFTVRGTGFQDGQTRVVLSHPVSGELGTTIYSTTETQITGAVQIPAGVVAGPWRLNVTTDDGGSSSRAAAFRVVNLSAPKITSFAPTLLNRDTTVTFTLNGDYFQSGGRTQVNLTAPGQQDIPTILTSVYTSRITGTAVIPADVATGKWGVNVTTADGGTNTKTGLITVI